MDSENRLIDDESPKSETEIKPWEDRNFIGSRGEAIANIRLTEKNIFSVYFLGDKAKTIDFLLEISDNETPYFALLQVKSTAQEQKSEDFLSVALAERYYKKLVIMPLPTYLIGVDEEKEIVYFTPVFSQSNLNSISKMPKKYRLKYGCKKNIKYLHLLKEDIIDFSNRIQVIKTQYKSKLQGI